MKHVLRWTVLSLSLLLGLTTWPVQQVLGQTETASVAASTLRPLSAADSMGDLLDNPRARAVLERELPELMQNERIEQARPISLVAMQRFAPTLVTDERIAAVNAALLAAGALSSAPLPGATANLGLPVDPLVALNLETVPLWPDGAPGALEAGPAHTPTVTVIAPDGATAFGTAVIVAPGGGYQALATGHEGRLVGDWLAAHGITAFVLNYRLCTVGYRHPTQLHDARRALRWVRAHAAEYGIQRNRIGMLGFSAGGHLTAMASTLFEPGNPEADDPVEQVDSRPDFAVLAYAPTRFGEVRDNTRTCFLGDKPGAKVLREVDPVTNVTASTPPTFIYHTTTDALVSPGHATAYYDALVAAGVPAELHIFGTGWHGQGLALADPVLGAWPDLLASWLRKRQLIGVREPMGDVSD